MEDLKGQTLYDLASIKNYKEIADEVTNNDDIDTMDYFYPNSLNKNMSNFQFVLSEMPNYEISQLVICVSIIKFMR